MSARALGALGSVQTSAGDHPPQGGVQGSFLSVLPSLLLRQNTDKRQHIWMVAVGAHGAVHPPPPGPRKTMHPPQGVVTSF